MALSKIQEALDVKFYEFQGKHVVTKQSAADFYGVDIRTITNCLNANKEELKRNGYILLTGDALKEFAAQFD